MFCLFFSLAFELLLPLFTFTFLKIKLNIINEETIEDPEKETYLLLAVVIIVGFCSVACSFLSLILYKKAGSRIG